MAIWRCPVYHCSGGPFGGRWQFTETAATVEALVTAHAREHQGVLPDPVALAEMRRDRAVALLDEHLCSHSPEHIETWLTKILPGKMMQARGLF